MVANIRPEVREFDERNTAAMRPSQSLFDRVSEVLTTGDALNRIAESVDQDETTTNKLTLEALAVLIAGAARQAADGDELQQLVDNAASLDDVDPNRLTQLLLGPRWSVYLEGLAEVNKVSATAVHAVVVSVAPVFLIAIKERQLSQPDDAVDLAAMLKAERHRLVTDGLLSWAPHDRADTQRTRSASPHVTRNVAKHRRHDSDRKVRLPSHGASAADQPPKWLFWSLAVVVLILGISWTLSLLV